ncbi:MAG TPA: hypothetical protein ENN27_03150 [Candidatus Atribacteria bacterium]|nr:hypothetical protein [Candidatus Atribacteria bacterium]
MYYLWSHLDRLNAFLKLLPKDQIVGFEVFDRKYTCALNGNLDLHLNPDDIPKAKKYSDLKEDRIFWVEANSHIEKNRIESWFLELETELHYDFSGKLNKFKRENIFLVYLSSYRTKEVWKVYDKNIWLEIIKFIVQKTNYFPVFIGAEWDDLGKEVFEEFIEKHGAINLIGKTPSLLGVIALLQQAKFYMGVISGLTILANVLFTPAITWTPRQGIADNWRDLKIPQLSLLWNNYQQDIEMIEGWLKNLN